LGKLERAKPNLLEREGLSLPGGGVGENRKRLKREETSGGDVEKSENISF